MLKHVDDGARQSGSEANRGVIQLITDKQTAFSDKCWKDSSVGHKSHAVDGCSLFANEFCHLALNLNMEIIVAAVSSWRAEGNAVLSNACLGCIGTLALCLCKAQIVVGAHVESLGRGTGKLEGEIHIIRLAVKQSDESTRHTSHRSPEAIVDSELQSSNVEVVEVAVERSIAISFLQMLVVLLSKPLAEEVSHVAKYDENEVGDVCGDEVEVRWFVLDWIWKI